MAVSYTHLMVGVPGLFKLAVIHISYQAELIFLYVINRKIIGVDIAEFSRCISTVSYTHLDVYKRQVRWENIL